MLSSLAMIVLFGWLGAGTVLGLLLGGRRGMLAAILLGWLFVPFATVPVSGLPDVSKLLVVPVSAFLGVLILDSSRLSSLKLRLVDLPMVLWCVLPLASSLMNGQSLWDGATAVLNQSMIWGIPWLLGRAYLGDAPGLRDLALTLVLGGLIYLPFCLWEIRMSPNLHHNLYGFHQHAFIQTRRFGGWRPMVFMQHGLAVGLFMAATALVATWLWISGAQRRFYGVPMSFVALALIGVTFLCKSTGSIALLALFLGLLPLCKQFRIKLPLLVLLLVSPLYMSVRATGIWSGDQLVTVVEKIVPSRASSLQTRFTGENLLARRALERPIVGWGGWGKSRATTESGNNAAFTDGLWIIALGQRGLLGLAALTVIMLAPATLLFSRLPKSNLFSAAMGPALALASVTVMFMLDSLLNAMFNPLWVLAMGGLAGAITRPGPVRQQAKIHAPSKEKSA